MTEDGDERAVRASGSVLRDIADAIALQQQGRLDDAERVYRKLLAQDDRDPTVLVNAGLLALARNDVAAALARLERAIKIVPANRIAHAALDEARARSVRG
jgi:Flp pilus assembly protein TadD